MQPLRARPHLLIKIKRRRCYLAYPATGPVALGGTRMLDLAFILIGAVFLGACALYALACDRL